MPALETPMGLALVVCDMIIEDRETGKKTLVGLFDRVQAQKIPCVHPAMSIFVSLTGGRGEYDCEIVCRHNEQEAVAFSAKGKVVLRDPRQVVDLVFKLKGVRFPAAGMYWVTFTIDGVPIMMRQMFIQQQEAAEGGKPPAPPKS